MISFLGALIPTRAKIIAGLVVVAGIVAKLAIWRAEKRGAKKATRRAEKADSKRSMEIENEADQVRRRIDGMSDPDVDDWLRDHPARRD